MILGDFNIPTEALEIPAPLKKYMVPGTINHVMCTGNIGSQKTLNFVKKISNNFVMVKGSQDLVC